ncbi:MAG: dihydrofolate reductase [Anaerolineales bacterium]|nr:dihydrofolate reductase [Anaerolineales bacterium]
MRKLKLQVQMSVDGFIAGPGGEMDWTVRDWGDDLNQYVREITETVDCVVLGRKLAQGFIPHWAGVAANPDHPEFAAGRIFTDMHKIVFSRTLVKSEWGNSILAKGDLVDEISKLKKQDGKDIIAYGGASFVSDLIKHDLIDEYHLFVNPVALGTGMAIFKALDRPLRLVYESSSAFSCGIVLVKYRSATG